MAGVLWRDEVSTVQPVKVNLGDRSYPIVFKSLKSVGETLKDLRKVGKCVLVSNSVVGPLYAETALASLREAGWDAKYLEIPDGEVNKTTGTYLNLVEQLLNLQVDRKTPVIGMGGGVTTDIVGFAAATTLRGVPFATIPTSLLAMVDASVGGKTGVNTSHGKNLLGAFWQPFVVLVPTETLVTLPDDELRCGMGEVVKHAVLEETRDGQPCTKFFEWLEAGNGVKVMNRDQAAMTHAIRRCCEIKAAVVTADERESGKRALLNLGHTVGHAIEQVLGFGAIRHGEAVGIGTVAEAQLAVLRGAATEALPKRIIKLLEAIGLPTTYPGLSTDALMDALMMDKKREAAHITVTVPYAIGDVRLEKLSPEDLRASFESLGLDTSAAVPAVDAVSAPGAPAPRSNGQSSNAFASGSNQNAGNVITDRPTTRIHQPPGGQSSIIFG